MLIIGGGFAGTALAYSAARQGVQVVLVEAGEIGSGTSAACAGRAQIIESETEEYLDLVLEGISKLDSLGEELGQDLEWDLPGHLTLLFNEEQQHCYSGLIERLHRHGVEAGMLDLSDLLKAEPNLRLDGCVGAAYSQEGHLNPFRFCQGYVRAARRFGAKLLTHTKVTGFEQQAGRIILVRTEEHRISAGIVVLAAGVWTGELARMARSNLPMHFTHAEAVVSEPLPRFIHHHIGMSGFYEAVHGQQQTVTLGVGQHRNGSLVISNAIQQTEEIDRNSTHWGMPALAKAVVHFFPALRNIRLVRTWASPSPFLPDYQPALGRMPGLENLYCAAGFHLAVPTIPLLAEAFAGCLVSGEAAEENYILKRFSPMRFEE